MHLTYIENVRIPSERAHAYQITTTCSWMSRLGHRVTLVNPDRAHDQDVFEYFHLEKNSFEHVRIPCWDILSWVPMKLKAIGYALQRASFIKHVKTRMSSHQTDVWYTRDLAMVDAFIDQTKAPWFVELHDEPTTNLDRWNRVKNRISGFVVISSGLKERLMELGVNADRIHVAPDGYEPALFESMGDKAKLREKYGIPSDAFVVFYQGRFYSWKGLDRIVSLWSKTDSRAYLVLMGGPEYERKRLEALVDEKGKDRVVFIDFLPMKEGIETHAIGDIGLLASDPNQTVSKKYTSPLKLFEYLAAGLPILASDVPSSRDVLDESVARFFGSGDVSFTNALESVINNPEWLNEARGRVRPFVLPYSWEKRTQAMLSFIDAMRSRT